jgi:GH18 family chitinase
VTGDDGAAIFYPDVLTLASAGWSEHRDEAAGVPYLLRDGGAGVVSFDDARSIQQKCSHIVAQGLGGGIVWHLGQDRIGNDRPLLRAAQACR